MPADREGHIEGVAAAETQDQIDPMGATASPGAEATMPAGDATRPAGVLAADYEQLVQVEPNHYSERITLTSGGMGRIVAAYDRRLRRKVAIKELRSQSVDLRARFEREALLTARLQHPNIVSVHEAGRWPSGEPFYAMKLVPGRSLEKVVAEAKSLAERIALLPHVIAISDALAYAHQQRIIHRDLKPQNVMVGEFGETVVIDWGLGKDLNDIALSTVAVGPDRSLDAQAGETAIGEVLGTPAYMPPEQAEGSPADERSDVYAIGAILYHLLAGVPPYVGPSSIVILDAVRGGPPMPLDTRCPDAPPDLLAVVSRSMARDPSARYPTARELADDLRRFQAGQLVGAHRYSTGQLVRRWLRRHRVAIGVAAAALLVLLVVGSLGFMRIVHERAEAEQARDQELALRLTEEAAQLVDKDPLRAARNLDRAFTLSSLERTMEVARSWIDRRTRYSIPDVAALAASAFSPDGSTLAVANSSLRSLTIWNTADWLPSKRIPLDGAYNISKLAFSPSGHQLAVATATCDFFLLDLGSEKVVWKRKLHDDVDLVSLTWYPDATSILVTARRDVERLDAKDGHTIAKQVMSSDITSATIIPKGVVDPRDVEVVAIERAVVFFPFDDAARESMTIPSGTAIIQALDAKRAFVSFAIDRMVYSVRDTEKPANPETSVDGTSLATATSNGSLLVGTSSGAMHVLDANDVAREVSPVWRGPGGPVFNLSSRPLAPEVAVGTSTELLIVDPVRSLSRPAIPTGEYGSVHDIKLGPNGTPVAAMGTGLWLLAKDGAGSKPCADVMRIDTVEWSPSGRYLMARNDDEIRIVAVSAHGCSESSRLTVTDDPVCGVAWEDDESVWLTRCNRGPSRLEKRRAANLSQAESRIPTVALARLRRLWRAGNDRFVGVVGAESQSLWTWRIGEESLATRLNIPIESNVVSVDARGRHGRIGVTFETGEVVLVDGETGTIRWTAKTRAGSGGRLSIDPSGTRYAVVLPTGTVEIGDGSTGAVTMSLPSGLSIGVSIAWLPDGKGVLVGGSALSTRQRDLVRIDLPGRSELRDAVKKHIAWHTRARIVAR